MILMTPFNNYQLRYGKRESHDPLIRRKMDTLYKKPGYPM
jgi:hypothetical protein